LLTIFGNFHVLLTKFDYSRAMLDFFIENSNGYGSVYNLAVNITFLSWNGFNCVNNEGEATEMASLFLLSTL
jgi:hypothetical protein